MAKNRNTTRSNASERRSASVFGSKANGIRESALGDLPPAYVIGAVLFALLAALPVAFGINPLPYYLGYISTQDIYSRVDFDWQDPEEEKQELATIERNYARRYLQEDKWDWASRVTTPLWHLLEQANGAPEAPALVAYAKEKGLVLEAEQAGLLITHLQQKRGRLGLINNIVSLMQSSLRDRIFPRGLLDEARFGVERGKDIQIINTAGEKQRVRVSRNSPVSPIEPGQLPAILDEGFALMPVDLAFRTVLRDLLLQRITPTLRFDEQGSKIELNEQKTSVIIEIQNVKARRTRLLKRGEEVTLADLRKLRAEDQEYRKVEGWRGVLRHFAGKAVLLLLLALGLVSIYSQKQLKLSSRGMRLVWVWGLSLFLVFVCHLLIYYELSATLVPMGLLAGVIALLLSAPAAILAAVCMSIAVLILFEGQFGAALACLVAGSLFGGVLPLLRHRVKVLGMSLLSGLLAMITVIGWGLSRSEPFDFTAIESFRSLLIGGSLATRAFGAGVTWLVTGILMLACLPLLEGLFAITTSMRLHELQDQDHPLLRQLVMQAPGTYHHSVIVGTLAEAAAEAIGANALLAKVGSYYHDIGKLMKPEYFSENETGLSRHDSLKPSMSTLIIIAHVKDGAEMAREVGLPPAIIAIIEQHHGESLVSYFHHRAQQQAAEGEVVEDFTFRYPGPCPQSPETALVMLADSVEAATRSLEDPTPAHIRRLVHEILMQRLMDRQFEASGLTLTDLGRAEDAFFRVLSSMFHSRVKYPGQEKETPRRRR